MSTNLHAWASEEEEGEIEGAFSHDGTRNHEDYNTGNEDQEKLYRESLLHRYTVYGSGNSYLKIMPPRRPTPVHELTARELQDAYRASHGFFLYSDCELDELVKFARDRGLLQHLPKGSRGNKDFLMGALDAADQSLTSDFLGLPAELRNAICEYHFQHLDEYGIPVKHQQPAITRMNRATRAEILPLFYQSCAFSLAYSSQYRTHKKWTEMSVWKSLQAKHNLEEPTVLTQSSWDFLHRIPAELRGLITKVKMDVYINRGKKIGLKLAISIEVDKTTGTRTIAVSDVLSPNVRDLTIERTVKKQIDKMASEISVRVGNTASRSAVCWTLNDSIVLERYFQNLARSYGR